MHRGRRVHEADTGRGEMRLWEGRAMTAARKITGGDLQRKWAAPYRSLRGLMNGEDIQRCGGPIGGDSDALRTPR
jgi:hypothetical protein